VRHVVGCSHPAERRADEPFALPFQAVPDDCAGLAGVDGGTSRPEFPGPGAGEA
jgi:hypothetical protein